MNAPTPTAAGTPLPSGFVLALDADTKQLDETTLFGGSPSRVLRLSPAGRTAWSELRAGAVASPQAGTLARRLVDAGLAHPRPPAGAAPVEVTVIIPVRDRAELLARCLRALGHRHPVLVVDDGSRDPQAVAEVAAAHDATVLPRADNGGPAAARNCGLSLVSTDVVAFLDSDCVPPPDWIERLSGHFADPLVAAVAPRIVALPSATSAGRYGAARGSLDLGDRAARVVPCTRVAYVPTAALLVRRAALLQVAQDGRVFDPALRYGEDVDLIWRLHEAGWRIRYDPAVQVGHSEPQTWRGLLSRRFRYGTSAAALAAGHPGAIAPLVLQPWPALTVAALLTRRPVVACGTFAVAALTMARSLRSAGLPARGVLRAVLTAVYQTWLGAGRYGTQFAAPALVLALLAPGSARHRRTWPRRVAVSSLLLGAPLITWATRRPGLDPVRFTLAHLADDIAYGAGVHTGCARARTRTPLTARIVWRPMRAVRADPTAAPGTKGPS